MQRKAISESLLRWGADLLCYTYHYCCHCRSCSLTASVSVDLEIASSVVGNDEEKETIVAHATTPNKPREGKRLIIYLGVTSTLPLHTHTHRRIDPSFTGSRFACSRSPGSHVTCGDRLPSGDRRASFVFANWLHLCFFFFCLQPAVRSMISLISCFR